MKNFSPNFINPNVRETNKKQNVDIRYHQQKDVLKKSLHDLPLVKTKEASTGDVTSSVTLPQVQRDKDSDREEVLFEWFGHEVGSHSFFTKEGYFLWLLPLFCIIVYALFTQSPIMAITFVLIGVVSQLLFEQEEKKIRFSFTKKGVCVGRECFAYEQITSFWLWEQDMFTIQMKTGLVSRIFIPFQAKDRSRIHGFLAARFPEKKPDPSILDNVMHFSGREGFSSDVSR